MYSIMVLYIMRHERRDKDKFDFFSPLNMVGKHYAKTHQFSKFNEIDLDEIYSSPFKRTLDTVSMISVTKKIPIKIDWSLSEKITHTNVDHMKWPSYEEQKELHDNYDIDRSYIPIADSNYINTYSETIDSYLQRVNTFSQFIKTQKDQNILVVTHQSIAERLILNITGKEVTLDMGECYEIN